MSRHVVAATRDGVPESATLIKNPASIKLEEASGNYVALDLGDGHYAFYEHLKPGSIRVKPNDRVHRGSVIGDVFDGAKPIHAALQRFKQDGRGVIVYLRDGTSGVPIIAIPHEGDGRAEELRTRQWREIGLGAQILKDLGISSIRLLASTKRTYVGLAGFGIEIVSTEAIDG